MRVQRQFFSWNTYDYKVQKVTGYACLSPEHWWVPSLGYTMTVGHSLFDKYSNACAAGLKARQEQITLLEKELARLKAI